VIGILNWARDRTENRHPLFLIARLPAGRERGLRERKAPKREIQFFRRDDALSKQAPGSFRSGRSFNLDISQLDQFVEKSKFGERGVAR
jgi:hypothetical protein